LRAWATLPALAAVIVTAAPEARADPTEHIGIGVLKWRYDDSGTPLRGDGTGWIIRTGADLNDRLGVGADVGGGGSDSVVVSGITYDVVLQLLVRLHARFTVPLSVLHLPFLRLYGLAGVATAQVETRTVSPGPPAPGPIVQSSFDTSTGGSLGAGAEIHLAGRWSAGVEWVRYLGMNGFDLDTASLFARYRFG
jgi:opacity protein-like surface antigen